MQETPPKLPITGKTKLLGVIGYPIEHSLSPLMHNAALQALGLDYVYLPFAVKPEDLADVMAGFAAIGLSGFNVTIPHKQAILPYLSEVTTIAQAIGAVNTVWYTEQGWNGTNTDVVGFLAPLKALDRDWSNTTALILGNGGAARAVVAGCTQLGCDRIQVVGRDDKKLESFLQSWCQSPLSVSLSVHHWKALPDLLLEATLLINTTPIGMFPHIHQSPLSEAEIDRLQPGTIAYDLIYTPNPTRFLQQAQARGGLAIDGLEMLVQQGAAALQGWLDQPVPIATMRQVLQTHLARA
ncbi:MAG: shikimate dehydrogenase [Scytolyngbya sp. HA4215-MV1]|jgi:shikimate dehydrogenase|nr:shikimate dehydrogenase [Scytolyngbya sp. HA4215-MV1]